METAPWRFWRFWSKRSKYRPTILEEDIAKLKNLYRNEVDVEITNPELRLSRRVKVTLIFL